MRPGRVERLPDPVEAALPHLLRQVGAWCVRLGGRGVDPEEATHEVLLILLRRRHDLRPGAPIEAWAYGVTRGVLRNHRRRAWLRRWVPGFVPDVADTRPDALLELEVSERAGHVRAILAEMTEAHREVLVLCDVEERSRAEVAELLDVPEGTVKSRLRLARARFRALGAERGLKLDAEVDDE